VDRVIRFNKAEIRICEMKIVESQRKHDGTEYAGLSANFLGFENWRISYIRRIFAELGVTRKDWLLDVGVGVPGSRLFLAHLVAHSLWEQISLRSRA